MATVYLDTSFVSACVTTRTDTQSVARRETSQLWWQTQLSRHAVFVSPEVLNEIADPEYPHSKAAVDWVASIPILPVNDKTRELAELFVMEKVMPSPATGDAAHVAIATVHKIEFLLSWNVRHLANPNKALHLRVICNRIGLTPPMIVTPTCCGKNTMPEDTNPGSADAFLDEVRGMKRRAVERAGGSIHELFAQLERIQQQFSSRVVSPEQLLALKQRDAERTRLDDASDQQRQRRKAS